MKYRWFFRPLLVLILSIIALGASFFLYLRWYLVARFRTTEIIERYGLDQSNIFEAETWIVILVLSALLVVIIAGIALIFFYLHKVTKLVRLQDNFISGFTHELKTPLASLQLAVDTFSRMNLDEEKREKLLKNMRGDIRRLGDNVGRILNLAKIEGKKKLVDQQYIEMNSFCEKALKDERFEKFQDCLEFRGTDRPLAVSADFDLLMILFENIITNAFKYNRSDSPRLRVELKRHRKYVNILFADNGIGIPLQDRNKIFRKFYQVGSSKNMSARGSGLGLYICSQIAKMHSGDIRLVSSSRQGSVFCLTLPLVDMEGM